jgi:predicted nucleotide-binding protein
MDSPIDLLKRLIAEGESFTFKNFCYPSDLDSLRYCGPDKPEWLAWKTRSYNLVRQLTEPTSPSSRLATEAMAIHTEGNYPEQFERAKSTFLIALRMTLDASVIDTFGELASPKSTAGAPSLSNKVFIVHGHDEALKTSVESFIHHIGLEPVVLHRQPDKGRTIIEKFEQHSDVGYAFILLTPDDVAYTRYQESLDDTLRKKEIRARQNVIFEFGYFVGKLGRNRVCCIYKEGVDIPSDLGGLTYKKVDDSVDPQAFSIIKELQAAGYKLRI